MKKLLLIITIFFSFAANIYSQCVGNCSLYVVTPIAYSVTPAGGTTVTLGDDQVSPSQPIGFTFTFMCNAYTEFYISSNGFISFNPAVSSGCCSGQVLPSPGNAVNNMIAFDWNDLYPPGAGSISYQTTGIAPNRRCIVTYTGIPHCCNAGPDFNNGQIILYETTNVIEIYSGLITNDGSTNTQGIMDATGNIAFTTIPARNGLIWTANGDAYRFTATPALPNCAGTPTPGTSQASPTTACATYTSVLSLLGSVQACNLTYQWQSAPLIGGPYVNIAGATASLATVTNSTSTIFYRCLLTCGGSTAASTPVNCVIPGCVGLPVAGTAVASPTTGCLTANSNLILTGTVAACGLTYQWQRATILAGPYTNIAGATTLTVNVTSTVTNYYRCIVSCGGNTAASVPATVSITPGPCPTCIGQYYLRDNIGEPWGSASNVTDMNAVFGATWTSAFYPSVNVVAMLQPTVSFIFMEGGDSHATAMNTFVTANIVAIQNWVAAGGKLLINAAPNVGGNMNWGFGGVTLNYAVGPYSADAYAAVGQAGHPIFNGPMLPAGTGTYTGNWFCHGYVNGGGVTNVIVGGGTPGASLAEKPWGAGRIMAGSMTTDNWHLPAPNSANLVQNIFIYLNCIPIILPVEVTDFELKYDGEISHLSWITASEKNTDYFVVEKSLDGINYSFFDKISAAGNSNQKIKYGTTDREPNKNGVTYYRLKQYDRGSLESKLNLVKTLNLKEIKKDYLKVQPNPANASMEVFLPEAFIAANKTLNVFDLSGSKVLSIQLGNTSSQTSYRLNIETLKIGVYSLQVINEDGASVKTTFIKN